MNRPAASLVPAGIAALATVVGVALQLAWLPDLPADIAVHWGAGLAANQRGPGWVLTITAALVGMLLTVLAAIIGRRRRRGGRMPTAILAGVAVFLEVALAATVGGQVGGATIEIAPILAVGVAVGALAGAVSYVVVHRSPDATPAAVPATIMPLAPGEQAVWLGRATIRPAAAIGFLSVMAVVVGVDLWAAARHGVWWIVVVPVVIALIASTMLDWRVRVDAQGLTVRAVLGVPAFRVPLATITGVEVRDVAPLGDFGGFGIRLRPGVTAVATRSGAALAVDRVGGRRLVVTVDDAATAAALLEALRERAPAA